MRRSRGNTDCAAEIILARHRGLGTSCEAELIWEREREKEVIRSEDVLRPPPSDPNGSPALNVLCEAGYLVSGVSRRDSMFPVA